MKRLILLTLTILSLVLTSCAGANSPTAPAVQASPTSQNNAQSPQGGSYATRANPPTATLRPTSPPTATSSPTPDPLVSIAYPLNSKYRLRFDPQKWDYEDNAAYNFVGNSFLVHKTIRNCTLGLVPAVGVDGFVERNVAYIGEKNWQEWPEFGFYFLIDDPEINFAIGSPYDDQRLQSQCRQDALGVIATLFTGNDFQSLARTPMPTYTPDLSVSGWRPCGEDYPVSYLTPNRTAFVSYLNPSRQRIRKDAGRDQEVIELVAPGGELTILDAAPKCANGWIWWKVRVEETGVVGWTAEGDGKEIWIVKFYDGPLP